MHTVTKAAQSAPLLGFWYPALRSRAVRPGRMQAQTLLGLPLVLCRDSQGRVAALRDVCPHRAMPFSFGHFDGTRLECGYHGWQFDLEGRCRYIPALVEGAGVQSEKIAVMTYPARDQDGYIWVYVPDTQGVPAPLPEVPTLPVLSEPYRMLHIATTLTCTLDNGIVGLMDPAHGPFVHSAWWWRSRRSVHEKAKAFAPSPWGFTMSPHAPSSNSRAYRLVGGAAETEITFRLPSVRVEQIRAGRHAVANLTALTPIDATTTEVNHCIFWTAPWLSALKPALRPYVRAFLRQDRDIMERQQQGLRSRPVLSLIDDADAQARWYYRLKEEYRRARAEERPFANPVAPRILRWRS